MPDELNAIEVGGIFDGLFEAILKSFKPDLSKWDRAKAKSAVSLLCDSFKPTITLPADLDDKALDMVADAIHSAIDKIGVQDGKPITVGGPEYTAADVDTYLGGFNNVSSDVRNRLKKRPRTLHLLKTEFTQEQQAKIVGNPILIALLTAFGPMIVEWIIKFLTK